MIIGNTIAGDVLKSGFILEKDNPLRDELFIMEEMFEIKEYTDLAFATQIV